MECNKDEATRAKEIAERKFIERDIAGSKKFALKAQNLYPGLEGLPQMLASLDVHLSAETKINGEPDWYGILGVTPMADDETVKKQYRKLALILHPDKNKSLGADGAFKLISQAWNLLSDKSRRTAYDQVRVSVNSQQKVSASGDPPASSGAYGFQTFSNTPAQKVGSQRSKTRMGPSTAPAPRASKPSTFWTACHGCKMQYEYQRIYLNHNLLCPNCHEAFLAVETAPPPSKSSKTSKSSWYKQTHNSSNQDQANFQWSPFTKTAGAGSTTASASTAAQAASMVQQTYEKVKREREEAQAAAKKREAHQKKHNVSKRAASNLYAGFPNAGSMADPGRERPAKKRNIDDGGKTINNGLNLSDQKATANGGTGMGSASGFKQGGLDKALFNKPNSIRELSQLELRNMLAEKASRDISKKINEWRLAAAAKSMEKENGKQKGTAKETAVSNGNINELNELAQSVNTKKGVHEKKALLDTSGVDLLTKAREHLSITVPDPDFHDFDRDRSEKSFGENQVWAAYDDDDGMPRYYAIVHKVISLSPFKMRISWLNSKTNNELGPLNWVGSGFTKTCGDFRVGKYELNNSLNSFSHRVRWTKGTRGVVKIFPRKGDVWALYRNWSPDWSELTPDEVIHKYDMVEVVDDYDEEQGIFVTPLVKVAGFKTVFHRHLDPREVKKITREEMFRFSHQVPSYWITGSEAHNAPKGCRELDPAATPLELLQIITEVKEEEMLEIAEERTIAEAKEVRMVENAGEQLIEGKEEVTVDNAKGEIATSVKEKEVVEIAEKQVIKERKDVTMENAEERKLAEAKEVITVENSGEQVIEV